MFEQLLKGEASWGGGGGGAQPGKIGLLACFKARSQCCMDMLTCSFCAYECEVTEGSGLAFQTLVLGIPQCISKTAARNSLVLESQIQNGEKGKRKRRRKR